MTPPKTTHIVYHIADLDGHASGLVALEASEKKRNVKLYGHDYGFDHEELVNHFSPNDDIIMLDITLPQDFMVDLAMNHHGDFILIDHHASRFDELRPLEIRGVLEKGKAACVLAWEYFFPEKEIPMGIELLGQYDVWDKKGKYDWEKEVLPFQYYWKYRDTDPEQWGESSHLRYLLHGSENVFRSMIASGVEILDYQRRQCKIFAESYAHEERFFFPNYDGKEYKALCINSNLRGSIALESVFNDRIHDFMCVYAYTDGKWVLSFYHPDPPEGLNLGELASKGFGGGGHKGAAGCQLSGLPWAWNI